jgi:hypothetical protein
MIRKTMTVLALGLAMTAAGANLAMAQSAAAKAAVDAAKAAGTVGEQADGYLGVVAGGDPRSRRPGHRQAALQPPGPRPVLEAAGWRLGEEVAIRPQTPSSRREEGVGGNGASTPKALPRGSRR